MQISLAYPAYLEQQDDGSILVRFRDLPEALTDGDDHEEALEQARDCLDEALAGRLLDRGDIPRSSGRRPGEVFVSPSLRIATKVALALAQRRAMLSNIALAALLELNEKEIRRLLDPRHKSGLDRLETAVQAAGGEIKLTLKIG